MVSLPTMVTMMLAFLIPYTKARIEPNHAHQINDIFIVYPQNSPKEYSFINEMMSLPHEQPGQNLINQYQEQKMHQGTSRPETVLSRPSYDNQKRISQTEYQHHKRASPQLQNVKQPEYYNQDTDDTFVKEIMPQDEYIIQYNSPTFSTSKESANDNQIISNSLRKRKFVLVESRDGKSFSLQQNRPRLDEYQAQRPPTGIIYPLLNNPFKSISYGDKYNHGPEPTFESVSPLDLQIEKIDGSYLSASGASIQY